MPKNQFKHIYKSLSLSIEEIVDIFWSATPLFGRSILQNHQNPGGKIYKIPPSWDFGMKIRVSK